MNDQLEQLKQALLAIRDTFVRVFEAVKQKFLGLVEELNKAQEEIFRIEEKKKLKLNTDLWMYPPVIESEIHPFVFDERCEKCAKKAVHRRQYISSLKLLFTKCMFCGATWWQRPADYNETVQISNIDVNITTVAGGGGSNGGRFSGGGGNKIRLNTEDLDISKFKDDRLDAFRYFKDDFFKRAGSTEKDDENAD